MDAQEIEDKIAAYAEFVDTRLRPDLAAVQERTKEIRDQLEDYRTIRTQLEQGEWAVERSVDLGHGRVFGKAKPDASTIFLHLGMGFHIELTPSEAIVAIDRRMQYLQENRLDDQLRQQARIEEHLQSYAQNLAQLSSVLEGHQ